ncbi:hypothetical protein V6C27_02850 [Peptococcaceae bacterium 1198_IL3148]
MAVVKTRCHRVIITDHAWQRWQERAGIKIKRDKLTKLLTAKLNTALAVGLKIDHTGAGWLMLDQWLWANVRVTDRGWVVTTFINWRNETMEWVV